MDWSSTSGQSCLLGVVPSAFVASLYRAAAARLRREVWTVGCLLGLVVLSGCGSDATVEASASSDLADQIETADAAEPSGNEFVAIAHRYLGSGPGVGTARTTRQLISFAELEPVAPAAEMDWDNEVVFLFTLTQSEQCPVGEFQGLEFFAGDLRLYPVFERSGSGEDCSEAVEPYSIAVAVARSDLPQGEFAIWVDRSDPEPEEAAQATYFAAGELTALDPSTVEFPPLAASGDLAVGEARVGYSVTTHCGLDVIYRPIDGRQWQLADGSAVGVDYVPPEWQDFVRGQEIDLAITRIETDLLEVAPLGSEATRLYEPMIGNEIGCD